MKKIHPMVRVLIFLLGLAVINYASMIVAAFIGSILGSKGALGATYMISFSLGTAAFIFYGRRWLKSLSTESKNVEIEKR